MLAHVLSIINLVWDRLLNMYIFTGSLDCLVFKCYTQLDNHIQVYLVNELFSYTHAYILSNKCSSWS